MSEILTGDCIDVLKDLPESSVHMCMTSPPYWNLRDYDHQDQLGLEEDSAEYVSNIADVFDELKRVLRPDGSLWLNLGDTYENKDLQQIPARVALELQNRGWILRNRVTWDKPNPMPQSVKDRLNDTTEAIFHFVLNKSYWYDLDAIREPHSEASEERMEHGKGDNLKSALLNNSDSAGGIHAGGKDSIKDEYHSGGKNPGDVFEVTTKPFPDAHFAVYPPELCEKPIKATCPPKVCAECGTPYERDVERKRPTWDDLGREHNQEAAGENSMNGEYPQGVMSDSEFREWRKNNPDEFHGWIQLCECDTDATESGIALDPFAGAGTTLLKAKELGRDFIGIELNPEYADMARARVGLSPNDPANIRDAEDQQGLEKY